jgi:uncharacterized protein
MTPFDPIKPPHTTVPFIIILLLSVVIAVLIGIIGQEQHWFNAINAPNGTLARAERDFRKGDNRVAIALFTGLAKKNDPVAQYWLAHMTEFGLGVPRDPAKAVGLYKRAADQDLVSAELRLGEIYLHGNLVPPDFGQAKHYLEAAAYHGAARAAMLLGQMYRIGLGAPADPTKAYAWSEVATLEGSTFAKRERDASLRDIKPQDQQAAIARANEILKEIKQEKASPNPPKSSARS